MSYIAATNRRRFSVQLLQGINIEALTHTKLEEVIFIALKKSKLAICYN